MSLLCLIGLNGSNRCYKRINPAYHQAPVLSSQGPSPHPAAFHNSFFCAFFNNAFSIHNSMAGRIVRFVTMAITSVSDVSQPNAFRTAGIPKNAKIIKPGKQDQGSVNNTQTRFVDGLPNGGGYIKIIERQLLLRNSPGNGSLQSIANTERYAEYQHGRGS